MFEMGTEKPVKICKEAIRRAKDYGNDIVIIDTAGRLQIDESADGASSGRSTMRFIHTDILLVVDAMTGQEAVNVAKTFDDLLDITGVILTSWTAIPAAARRFRCVL